MPARKNLGSLNLTYGKPSLSTFQLNIQVLADAYNTTRDYSAGLVLNQANPYNRTDLFAASPLAYATLVGLGATNTCGCPNLRGRKGCCPVQYSSDPTSCGVSNSVGQCVNPNPFG